MKKLVKFLLPLISLLFIINVKANTNYEYYFEFKYGEVLELKETYFNEISIIDNYLNNIYSTGTAIPYQVGWNTRYIYLNTGDFVAVYDLSSFENEVKTLYLFDVVTYPITMRIPEGTNPFSIGFMTGLYYKIQFKIENNAFVPYGTNGYQSIMPIYESTTPLNDNLTLYEDKYYFNTTWLTSQNGLNSDMNLNNLSNTYNYPLKVNDNLYYPTTTIKLIDYLNNYYPTAIEPTYSYESTILENGNVKLDFTFTNYNENSGYAFEIENGVSNEEYGITNTYSNIFPNQIPFGSSFSIELPFDTFLYITLAKYEQVENTSLYYREEIYTNMIDINNIVFENPQDPYFVIYRQNKNLIEGSFANTTSQNTCWYRYSTSQNEDFVPCNELVGFSVYDNGYVEVIIKKGSQTVYSRKINYLGSNQNEPYIQYQVVKQDFYSIVNWSVQNYVNNLTFRYSIDNGNNFTTWSIYNNNQNYYINVFDNSTTIVEIANSDQSTIYDSKAIIVVNDINNIKNINNTTTNFIDKFKSLFTINGNILNNVSNFYDNIKLSKVYLLIFIPFLTSLIAGIIYLIRRK